MMNGSCTQTTELPAEAGQGVSADSARRGRVTLRVLLAGPMSGPVGGVSVHLRRLHSWLRRQGIAVELVDEGHDIGEFACNLRTLPVVAYLTRVKRCNIAHIQSSQHLFRWLHLVTCRLFGLYVVVTIHSWRASAVVTMLNRLLLRLAHRIIVVNEEIATQLKLASYDVIPAFLPPLRCTHDLPADVRQFIDSARDRGCALLCANASRLTKYHGEDLYGLDLCLELVADLAGRSDVNPALVYAVSYPAAGNPLYLNARKLIVERGLEDRVCLYNKPLDFVALMTYCDVVLRPTTTDGDALTVREALYLGVPVIASDVAKRPEGTILFSNRDEADFADHILAVLKGPTRPQAPPRDNDCDTHVSQYVDVYYAVCDPSGNGRHGRKQSVMKVHGFPAWSSQERVRHR